jgi:cysteate synthase
MWGQRVMSTSRILSAENEMSLVTERSAPRRVRLECYGCGAQFNDRRLECDVCADALLRTVYDRSELFISEGPGLFRFQCWLPGGCAAPTESGPTIVNCERYAHQLGLSQLAVAFNGYWPERGALNPTGSFKDLEAAPTLGYFRECGFENLILASAGNTARAFAYACSQAEYGCWLVVPEAMCHRLWLPMLPAPSVRIITVQGSSDYCEAIRLGREIARRLGITWEGGVRNVARRDGVGTILLEYARTHGAIPQHYVQAVGSGLGALAIYEASSRLRDDGRFGSNIPKIHLVQNSMFSPIHDAWSVGSRTLQNITYPKAIERDLYADVLANPQPSYAERGGVWTALSGTGGKTYAVSAKEAIAAKSVFEVAEGVSINEASACACAGLEIALATKAIDRSEKVLLNITGGGEEFLRRDYSTVQMKSDLKCREGLDSKDLDHWVKCIELNL